MSWKHFSIFLVWTALIIVAVSALLFIFTYGDCVGNIACEAGANRATATIIGGGFLLYWAVAFLLFRRWNR